MRNNMNREKVMLLGILAVVFIMLGLCAIAVINYNIAIRYSNQVMTETITELVNQVIKGK